MQVIIANYECDSDKNRPLAEKIGIESFPTIKFYPKGSDKTPIVRTVLQYIIATPSYHTVLQDYEEGRDEVDLVKFLNNKCGTHRAVGGGLNDEVYFERQYVMSRTNDRGAGWSS